MSKNEILEVLREYADAQENSVMVLKQAIRRLEGNEEKPKSRSSESGHVREETFTCLKWNPQSGTKLGEFETAQRRSCLPEKFDYAKNILEVNNTTISSRYVGFGYVHSYWLYGQDAIFRKKLKTS